ncbi:MAG: cell division protein FtsQ/DivIB [Gaiellaceae bacterium]
MAAPRARTSRTRVAAAPSPRGGLKGTSATAFLPTGRSLLVGFGLVAVALGLYAGVRRPSVFAVDEVRVKGAPPALASRIEHQLHSVQGTSLVTLDGDGVLARVESLPMVHSARYDRAFPHTLVVTVVPEQPAAILRRGADAWLLSTRGRVVGQVARGSHARLPRVWAPKTVPVETGRVVSDADVRAAVLALPRREADKLPIRIRATRSRGGELAFVLANGLELRLGSGSEVALKLAAAREILPRLAAPAGGGPTYLDVSVPERPVAGTTLESEVEVEG